MLCLLVIFCVKSVIYDRRSQNVRLWSLQVRVEAGPVRQGHPLTGIPDKTKFWQKAGIDLVIDRREGYFLYDMSGRRLIDLHLNGGTYNFGHRHPELVETLKGALDYFDIGNHWFPSVARAALAEVPDQGLAGHGLCGLRARRRRGGGHRHQERALCDQAAQDRLHHQGLSRPFRPLGCDRRRPLHQDLPRRTSPTFSSRCPSTTSTSMEQALARQ